MPIHVHSMTERHRSTDDATGADITAGFVPTADGTGGVEWTDPDDLNAGGIDTDLVRWLDIGLSSTAFTVDWADAPSQYITLNNNCTATLTGLPATVNGEAVEGRGRLWIETDGTDTITWPVTVVWQDSAPDLSVAGVYFVDFITFDGGTTFYGVFGGEGTITAADVAITDAGAYYTGTDVEAALQEVGADIAALEAASGDGDHEHMIDVFNGDGATTVFEITDEPIDPEAVFAFVSGSWTAITVSGAMNTTITFGSAPGSGTGNVVVQYPAVAA